METKRKPISIPVVSAEQPADDSPFGACSGAEPFALMVLGDSMEPEFVEREIIVVEPEGLATDGSYVIAFHNEEYIFRQLIKREAGWALHALNPAYPDQPIASLSGVRGVVIMKRKPGRPSKSDKKYYVVKETPDRALGLDSSTCSRREPKSKTAIDVPGPRHFSSGHPGIVFRADKSHFSMRLHCSSESGVNRR